MPLHRNFLNENINRLYPFEHNNAVPTPLIVDFGIIATPNLSSVYIDKIVTDGVTIQVSLHGIIDEEDVDLGFVAEAATEEGLFTEIRFQLTIDDPAIVLAGFITFGDMSVATSMPAVTTLDADTGSIYSGCLKHMDGWLAGIKVNGTVLSGVIELVGGSGVALSVSGNTVTIQCTGATVPPDNNVISSDTDIFNDIKASYGVPITIINGVTIADGTNEWNIAVPSTDSPLKVETNAATGSILVSDASASACCGESAIKDIVDNIAALNERAGIIEQAQTQLETNINTVSTQLARML